MLRMPDYAKHTAACAKETPGQSTFMFGRLFTVDIDLSYGRMAATLLFTFERLQRFERRGLFGLLLAAP